MFPSKNKTSSGNAAQSLVATVYDGSEVSAGALVRSGAYLAWAKVDTALDPAPVQVGEQVSTYAGAFDSISVDANTLTFGHSYTLAKDYFVYGFHLHTIEGLSYRVFALKNGVLRELAYISSATITGETFYPYKTVLPAGQQFALVVVKARPDAEETEMTANFTYSPYNDSAPANGYITHSNYPFDKLRVPTTDADGNDVSDLVLGLVSGDSISDGQRNWMISAVSTEGGDAYRTFTITPSVAGDIHGYKAFTFTTKISGEISCPLVADHWANTDEISGLFGADTGLSLDDLEENDNVYGINLVYAEGITSPDHILLACSPEFGDIASG